MQCGYCDQNQENLLATCMTCHAHFCNTNDKPTALSHILKHLKQTQHNSFSVPGKGILQCWQCGKNNIIDLFVTSANAVLCSEHKSEYSKKIVEGKKIGFFFPKESQSPTMVETAYFHLESLSNSLKVTTTSRINPEPFDIEAHQEELLEQIEKFCVLKNQNESTPELTQLSTSIRALIAQFKSAGNQFSGYVQSQIQAFYECENKQIEPIKSQEIVQNSQQNSLNHSISTEQIEKAQNNLKLLVNGKLTEITVYDESNSTNSPIFTPSTTYILDIVPGKFEGQSIIKALIFTSLNHIHLIYHPKTISDNVKKSIFSKNTHILASEKLFKVFQKIFEFSGEKNVFPGKCSKISVNSSNSVQEFVKNGVVFERSAEVLNQVVAAQTGEIDAVIGKMRQNEELQRNFAAGKKIKKQSTCSNIVDQEIKLDTSSVRITADSIISYIRLNEDLQREQLSYFVQQGDFWKYLRIIKQLKAIKAAHSKLMHELQNLDSTHELIVSNYFFDGVELPSNKQQINFLIENINLNEEQQRQLLVEYNQQENYEDQYKLLSQLKNSKTAHTNLMTYLRQRNPNHELIVTNYTFDEAQLPSTEEQVYITLRNIGSNENEQRDLLCSFNHENDINEKNIIKEKLVKTKKMHSKLMKQLKDIDPDNNLVLTNYTFDEVQLPQTSQQPNATKIAKSTPPAPPQPLSPADILLAEKIKQLVLKIKLPAFVVVTELNKLICLKVQNTTKVAKSYITDTLEESDISDYEELATNVLSMLGIDINELQPKSYVVQAGLQGKKQPVQDNKPDQKKKNNNQNKVQEPANKRHQISKDQSDQKSNKNVKNAQIHQINQQIQPQMVLQQPVNGECKQGIIDRFSETFLDQFDQLEDLKMQNRSGNSNSIRLEISSLTAQINDNIAEFKATGLQVIGSVEKRVKQFLDEEVKSKNVDVLDVMRQLDELNRQSQNLGVGSQARQDEMKKVVPQQAQQVPQAGNQAETLKKFKNDIRGLIEEYNILKAQIDVKASASLILKVTKLIRKMDATRSEFMQTGIALPAEMNRFLASFDEKLENEQICKQMQLMVQNAEQLIESISGSGPENEEFSNQIIQQIDEFDAVFQAGNGKVSDRIKEFRTVHQTTLKAFIETGSTISEDVKECLEQFYRGVQNKVKARLQYESAESIPEAPSQPQTPTYRTSTRTAVCQPFNQISTPQKYVPSAPQQQGQPLLVQTAIYQPIAPQFAQPNVQQSQPSQPPNQKLSGPPPAKQKRSQVPPPQHQQPQTSQIGPPPPQPRPTPQQLSAPPGPQQSQQLSAPPQPIRPNYQNPSHLASPPPPNSNQPSRPPPQQYLSPPPAPMRPQRQNNQKPPHLASPPRTMTVQPPLQPHCFHHLHGPKLLQNSCNVL